MGRPKASQANLRIAETFANAITLPSSKSSIRQHTTGWIGFVSADAPFVVLANCVPSLVRDSRDRYPVNRDGVTSAELRKHLIRQAGYVIQRWRRRKSEASRPATHGMMWSNRRWVDFNDNADRSHLKSRIVEILEAFPSLAVELDPAHIACTISAIAENDRPSNECDEHNSECSVDGESSDETGRSIDDDRDTITKSKVANHPNDTSYSSSFHSILSSNRSVLCTARRQVNISPSAPLATRCYLRILPNQWNISTCSHAAAPATMRCVSICPPGSPTWAAFVANVHYELGIKAC